MADAEFLRRTTTIDYGYRSRAAKWRLTLRRSVRTSRSYRNMYRAHNFIARNLNRP